MKYETPDIPEGINVAPRNHLVDFLILTVGAVVIILTITFLLSLASNYIAKKIPFETELTFSEPFEEIQNAENQETNDYLRSLIATIAVCSDLPEGMEIKYNYQGMDLVNAFATLGGNIVLFQGLINKLDNENELAMIIAHEIAHVKNRHPIQSLGRTAVLKMAFSLVIGNSATNPIENSGLLTSLKFSRDMETEADNEGIKALNECYGHINGATAVFRKLEDLQQKQPITPLAFLSTHPMNEDRISNIEALAKNNNWNRKGLLIDLPKSIKTKIEKIEKIKKTE